MAHEVFQQIATGAPQAWDKKAFEKKKVLLNAHEKILPF